MSKNIDENWKKFVETELKYFQPKIEKLGFVLLESQPHLKGERSAFRSQKLILLGKRKEDGLKVVIKVSREKLGASEVEEEVRGKSALSKIKFSYTVFNDPRQIYFEYKKREIISITQFIEEDKKFLDRDLKEQFLIVHEALTTLEGVHVVVKKHQKEVEKFFKIYTFDIYKKELTENINYISESFSDFQEILNNAKNIFLENKNRIEQYQNFLTHFDFVPHNFRVADNKIYLLDHSSLRIGNKHEGWARFLNFCILYNQELEEKFLQYFEINRSREEKESLYLMRIFRFVELIAHHTKIYFESEGNLKVLSKERVLFWVNILNLHLKQEKFDQNLIEEYKNKRDNLRSLEEKERQKVLY